MKYSYYIILSFCLFFLACNKTAADKITTDSANTMDATKVDQSWRASPPSPGKVKAIQLGQSTNFVMANGLKVIVVENHKLPKISYQLSLAHDALVEGDMAGYTSMAGSLLKTGTTTKSKGEIDEAIDFLGARLSTSGGGIFATSLSKHSEAILNIMTDVLYNPAFKTEEFDKIKKQTLSGIESDKTDPNTMASNVASILNYGAGHPYGELQTETSVANITLQKCKDYYNNYFTPNNAYLVVVGDITPAEAKAKVETHFGKWKSKTLNKSEYTMPKSPVGRKVAFVNKEAAVQSVIRITYPVDLKPGADDLLATKIMNSILGGGIFSGRLMQNLREDKAYTYGARSNISSDKLVGRFAAFASVRNEVTDSSVHEFLYEMERMNSELVNNDDLQLSKNSLAGGFARSLESPQTIARFALNTYKYNLPADYYNTYLERLEAVTIEDITRVAKKYIRPDNANIVVVGSKASVAKKLVKFDSDQNIQFYDVYGEEIKD